MYERPHHQRIQKVLESLDAQLLLKHQCLFCGGTAIALSLGEYRESVDIDFVVSSVDGYRELRHYRCPVALGDRRQGNVGAAEHQ